MRSDMKYASEDNQANFRKKNQQFLLKYLMMVIIMLIIIIIVYAPHRICPGEWDEQNSLGFCNTHRSPNFGQTNKPIDSQQQQQKKRICEIVDFAVPADHKVKLKEIKKKDKYLNFAWELKKLWNMKVTLIPIVIGVLGTVTKGWIKGIEDMERRGRGGKSKLQNCRDRQEFWRLEETYSHLNSSGRPSANAGGKNS